MHIRSRYRVGKLENPESGIPPEFRIPDFPAYLQGVRWNLSLSLSLSMDDCVCVLIVHERVRGQFITSKLRKPGYRGVF